jgi:hypothetical protein
LGTQDQIASDKVKLPHSRGHRQAQHELRSGRGADRRHSATTSSPSQPLRVALMASSGSAPRPPRVRLGRLKQPRSGTSRSLRQPNAGLPRRTHARAHLAPSTRSPWTRAERSQRLGVLKGVFANQHGLVICGKRGCLRLPGVSGACSG